MFKKVNLIQYTRKDLESKFNDEEVFKGSFSELTVNSGWDEAHCSVHFIYEKREDIIDDMKNVLKIEDVEGTIKDVINFTEKDFISVIYDYEHIYKFIEKLVGCNLDESAEVLSTLDTSVIYFTPKA